jgi:hypothetical protein
LSATSLTPTPEPLDTLEQVRDALCRNINSVIHGFLGYGLVDPTHPTTSLTFEA